MSTAYLRGLVLYNQGRHDLASKELRQAIGESPENSLAHALLAICLVNLDRGEEALSEASEAVRLDPGAALSHYAKGHALLQLKRLKEAESSAREAIRLEPADADFHGLLASVELARRDWSAALAAAEVGLALDPEHLLCTNLRALALVQLGRKEEASHALGSALANAPEDALTHCNTGWTLLHQGDHRGALEHFREALRLDPELEWARAGIVEALKAHYLIYRLMLRFFLWMSRQTRVAQWVVILGFIFGRKILADLADARPGLAPFIEPLLALTFLFMLLTWISSPLFNLVLRFNRFGRLALSREQRIASNWIGGCFLLAAVFFVGNLVTGSITTLIGMMFFALLLMPMAVVFEAGSGRPRWTMAGYTGLVALLGLPSLSIALLGNSSPWQDVPAALEMWTYYMYGCILATWAPALLASRFSEG